MFADRKDVRLVTNEYANLTDEELAKKLVELGGQRVEARYSPRMA